MAVNTPRAVKHVHASAQFDFVYGRFNLSPQWAIPYFATTMTMREAAESLRLVNDFPGNESMAWKLDELYQRDIDWGRVEREILPYLSSSEEPQFFNSLTIAFMPIRDNEVKQSFKGVEWDCPELPGQFAKTMKVGPISIGYWADWESPEEANARIGQIRWNPQQVFSVAIDGQHRLAALKLASKGFEERADKTQVPVLLLLLDDRVGFRAPAGSKLVDLMRTLFITLNKHAEKVSRPRQILLDDRDPHALCVRALVGDQLGDGTEELASGVLPLSLVDWHREQAKIDDGPYITTILGLDWIIEKTLRSKPIKDYSSYGLVSKQLRAISLSLGLNLHRPGSRTFQRLREVTEHAVEPFSYTGFWSHDKYEGELGAIVEAFRANWAKALVEVLTGFTPYAQLIARRRADGNLSAEFTNWYYLMWRKDQGERANDEYTNFVHRLKNRKEKPISKSTFETNHEAIEAIKIDNLAYKVAFQRALVLGFLEFVTIDGADLPDSDLEDENNDENESDEDEAAESNTESAPPEEIDGLYLRRAKEFVQGLNALVESEPEFLNVKGSFDGVFIWQGSLYNRVEDVIDFTLGASKRASHLVFIAAALALCKHQGGEAIKGGFASFWDGLASSEVGIHKKIWKTIDRKFADEAGAGGRIVLGREEAYSIEMAREEAKIRAERMWQALGMPGPSKKREKKK